jgi:hypothetical protein
VQETNVVFDKQCEANLVMVLDESGSISGSRTLVRNAVISFLSSFGTINQIGGTATLGLVEFDTRARLVDPTATAGALPGNSCRGKMCSLNSNWIGAVTSYMQNTGGNADDQKYTTNGCTNWGEALYLAATTTWTAPNDVGVFAPRQPDVLLFFTDGQPTVHTSDVLGSCHKNCNMNRQRKGTANMLVGRCYGSHVGAPCYWSDTLKRKGVKVFLVGVGGISRHIPNTEIITGPTAWDQQVNTFGTSDYVIDANFDALGAIFYNVAKGLCQCLQDQTPCTDAGGQLSCEQQQNFDARLKITTGPASVSYASNAVFESFMYYDFRAGPAKYAVEFLDTTGGVSRTDIINPCQVSRKISCGGSCFNTADLGFIPRFFIDGADVAGGPAAGSGYFPSADCLTGGSVFTKTVAAGGQGQEIRYIWLNAGGIVCAARSDDGTLYEFWTGDSKATTGVNFRGATAKPQQLRLGLTTPFDFTALDNCQSPICGAEVEIVFVMDYNMPQSDYFHSLDYVKRIAASFDDSNNRIRMGAWFMDPSFRVPAGTGLQSQLGVFGNQVSAVFRPNDPAVRPTNFYTAATAAINSFWPDAYDSANPPRYLITLIGSADTHGDWSAADRAAFNALRAERGVSQAWATGFAAGSSQLHTMESLSDSVPYTHYTALGTSDLLRTQSLDQSARMCPRSDTCGGTCQGQCLCGVCACPTCAVPADRCKSSSCPNPTSGCTILDKRTTLQAQGGCLPPPASMDPCVQYTCDAGTGDCVVGGTMPCGPNCNCAVPPPCKYNDLTTCVAGNGNCTLKPVLCSGDLCGQQCNNATGACDGTNTKACDDNNGCTDDNCVVRIVGGVQQGVCQYVDATSRWCTPPTQCHLTTCISTGAGSRTCNQTNITALFDLCGVCLGDFTECFFSSVVPASGGIAGGVIAAAVVGGIIAALLIAFFSRKGYMAYQAKSAMGMGHANTNPAFTDNSMR